MILWRGLVSGRVIILTVALWHALRSAKSIGNSPVCISMKSLAVVCIVPVIANEAILLAS